jgi:hypothetical protein
VRSLADLEKTVGSQRTTSGRLSTGMKRAKSLESIR